MVAVELSWASAALRCVGGRLRTSRGGKVDTGRRTLQAAAAHSTLEEEADTRQVEEEAGLGIPPAVADTGIFAGSVGQGVPEVVADSIPPVSAKQEDPEVGADRGMLEVAAPLRHRLAVTEQGTAEQVADTST